MFLLLAFSVPSSFPAAATRDFLASDSLLFLSLIPQFFCFCVRLSATLGRSVNFHNAGSQNATVPLPCLMDLLLMLFLVVFVAVVAFVAALAPS